MQHDGMGWKSTTRNWLKMCQGGNFRPGTTWKLSFGDSLVTTRLLKLWAAACLFSQDFFKDFQPGFMTKEVIEKIHKTMEKSIWISRPVIIISLANRWRFFVVPIDLWKLVGFNISSTQINVKSILETDHVKLWLGWWKDTHLGLRKRRQFDCLNLSRFFTAVDICYCW